MPFSASELKQMSSHDPESGVLVNRATAKFYKENPPNSADKKLAWELGNKKKAGTLLVPANLEESAWSVGSRLLYTPEEVTVVRPTGETQSYTNCVVPFLSAGSPRPGLFQLVGILASYFRYNGSSKKIDYVTQIATIETSWGVAASAFKPSGLIPLKEMFVDFIETSPLWKSYHEHQRASLTGPRWITFLESLFASCEWRDYFAFHSVCAYELLKTFRAVGPVKNTRYAAVTVKTPEGVDRPMIEPSSLIVLNEEQSKGLPTEAKKAAAEVRNAMKRNPVVMKGPFPTAHQFVDYRHPTFEKAYKAMSNGAVLRGGDDSGVNVLSSAIGYSGMPTTLARNQQLVVSAAAYLIGKVDKLDIYCESIGSIPLLNSSLNAARTLANSGCDWKYVTSFVDSSKPDPQVRGRIETAFRPGAHRLWISTKVMGSAKKVGDLLLNSGDIYEANGCSRS